MERIQILNTVFTFVAVIVGMACFTGIVVTWLKRRGRASELATPKVVNRLEEIAERLAHIDGAVDTIAIEVERISEAQRFTARVLAERAAPASLPESAQAPRQITPH